MNNADIELPVDYVPDETDISLRAHFSRMSDETLRGYQSDWTDEQVMEWDGNFRVDGALMLVCCERDIQIDEYRQVLHEHIQRRGLQSSLQQ